MLLCQLHSRKHWWSSAGRNTSHGSEFLSPKDTEVLSLELPGSLSSRLGLHRGTCLCQFLGLNQWHQLILGLELCQSYGYSGSHVWMWALYYKESWALKNWCFWTVVLEKTLESPLDNKKFKSVHPKGNQPWIFIVRANAEAEAPILWPVNGSQLFRKDTDVGKDWRQKQKRAAEDEVVGWYHWLIDHEFEHTPGDSDGQRSLACSSPQICEEVDATWQLNNNSSNNNWWFVLRGRTCKAEGGRDGWVKADGFQLGRVKSNEPQARKQWYTGLEWRKTAPQKQSHVWKEEQQWRICLLNNKATCKMAVIKMCAIGTRMDKWAH